MHSKYALPVSFACSLLLTLSTIALAQSPEIPPVPAPTPGVSVPPRGPIAQIAMDDGTGVNLKLRGKHAPRVRLRAGQRTTITLRYDPSYAGSTLEVAALDAGKITFAGNRNVVGPNGIAILQFSDAQRPGLYRVVVQCADISSTLQFWVPEPDNPTVDASVLIPTAAPSTAANSQ